MECSFKEAYRVSSLLFFLPNFFCTNLKLTLAMIYMYIICIFFKITPKNHTCTYGIKESLDFYLVLKTDVYWDKSSIHIYNFLKLWMLLKNFEFALFKREHFKCWTRQYISITVKEQWACVKALGNGNKVWMLAVGYVTHKAGPAEELA